MDATTEKLAVMTAYADQLEAENAELLASVEKEESTSYWRDAMHRARVGREEARKELSQATSRNVDLEGRVVELESRQFVPSLALLESFAELEDAHLSLRATLEETERLEGERGYDTGARQVPGHGGDRAPGGGGGPTWFAPA